MGEVIPDSPAASQAQYRGLRERAHARSSNWATIEIDGVQHIVHSIHGRGGRAERAADLGWDTLALFGLSEGRRHGRLWGGSTSCEYLVLCALQVT
jgi:hypothetical protein